MRLIPIFVTLATVLFACSKETPNTEGPTADTETTAPQQAETDHVLKLEEALNARPEEDKSRFDTRHPQQTLLYFDVQPGMTVAEVLPGKGWYSNILAPYLGAEGTLIGIDYDVNIWAGNFRFADESFIENRSKWTETWSAGLDESSSPKAEIEAYTFTTIPEAANNSVDRVLFIRALHHLFRLEEKGGFLTQALSDTKRILKPGGLIGVVQHQSPEAASDDWATGDAGYLKKSLVIRKFEEAGFTFISESAINENPNDNNPEGQIVWRLPPSYAGSETDEQKAAMDEIGESNRMTLIFKKP